MTKTEAIAILKMYYPYHAGDSIQPLVGRALVELDFTPGDGYMTAEINLFVDKLIILRENGG